MTVHEEFVNRIESSLWGQWLARADADAADLAQGGRRSRKSRRGELPAEVVTLFAVGDLRDMVLELADAVDRLTSEGRLGR